MTVIPYKILIILSVVCLGCHTNESLSGKVTFPDGSPLDCGVVLFENGGKQSKGFINSEGTYVIGSRKNKDGLPRGEYRVCIQGAIRLGEPEKTKGMDGKSSLSSMTSNATPLIAKKYTEFDSSGLTFVVDGTRNTFDIQVERP
ncbi:MAG: hypothetical protein LBU34_11650 [Planctomycetaceae bacterium]|jgi:hypothetical protein|nr:hypothetical protein [Planctomycetaceae bacterium]